VIVSTYISGAARWNAGPVATGLVETRPIAAGTVASYRLQEAAPGGGSTPTEGLTKRRTNLLMANSDPTGERSTIALNLPARHLSILRKNLTFCLDGVRDDLEAPQQLPNPEGARREAQAYERVLAALASGTVVVPDETAREAVAAMAANSDRENNYAEIVAEHDALHALLRRLEGSL
jgi:hypothetical protein